jgi:hypothetical protein
VDIEALSLRRRYRPKHQSTDGLRIAWLSQVKEIQADRGSGSELMA